MLLRTKETTVNFSELAPKPSVSTGIVIPMERGQERFLQKLRPHIPSGWSYRKMLDPDAPENKRRNWKIRSLLKPDTINKKGGFSEPDSKVA